MAELGRHQRQLVQYLDKHKNQNARSRSKNNVNIDGEVITDTVTGPGASKNSATSIRNVQRQQNPNRNKNTVLSGSHSSERTLTHIGSRRKKLHGTATINHLPDEILLKIFQYLEAHSLLRAASVSHHWQGIANDNFLWEKIFQHYASKLPGAKVTKTPENLPLSYWKQLCIKRCSEQRNKSAFHLLKVVHPYTGLPRHTEKSLKRAGVYFQLSVSDSAGNEHLAMTKDVFWHAMSVTVRWHSLTNVPMRNVRKIRVLACNPLFFESNGSSVQNSPYQRSLLLESDVKWSSWVDKNPCLASDDTLTLYRLDSGLAVAIWKDGGELAFVAVGLHFDSLVLRCLLGKANSIYPVPPHKVVSDDIDPCYGLHNFSVTVELRSMRQSLWSQQFQTVDCKREGIRDGYASFILIRRNSTIDHVIMTKSLNLPWKTELFKGVLKNVTWLDVVMLDEKKKVFWTISSVIKAELLKQPETLDFDYNGEQNLEVNLTQNKGKVFMGLSQMDDGGLFVTSLELIVKLSTIDEWFETSYTGLTNSTK